MDISKVPKGFLFQTGTQHCRTKFAAIYYTNVAQMQSEREVESLLDEQNVCMTNS